MFKKLTLIIMYIYASTSLYAAYDSSNTLTPETPAQNYVGFVIAFVQLFCAEIETALDENTQTNMSFHETTDELPLQPILNSHIIDQNIYTQVIPQNDIQPKTKPSSSTTSSTRTSGFDLCEISNNVFETPSSQT